MKTSKSENCDYKLQKWNFEITKDQALIRYAEHQIDLVTMRQNDTDFDVSSLFYQEWEQ